MNSVDAKRILDSGERAILDWYDGFVQVVLADPMSGYWFAFATQISGNRRRYCLLRVDRAAFDETSKATFASEHALMAFGTNLAARGLASEAYEVDVADDVVEHVRHVAAEEAQVLRPRSSSDLIGQ